MKNYGCEIHVTPKQVQEHHDKMFMDSLVEKYCGSLNTTFTTPNRGKSVVATVKDQCEMYEKFTKAHHDRAKAEKVFNL